MAQMDPSFAYFSDLPVEIRCKIWRAALPRRTVQFQIEAIPRSETTLTSQSHNGEQGEEMFIGPGSSHPGLPAVCFVNHESYAELGKLYQCPVDRRLLDGKPSEEKVSSLCKRFRTPKFNPEVDVMEWAEEGELVDPVAAAPFHVAALASARHVSIIGDSCDLAVLERLEMSLFDACSPLETLTLSYQGVSREMDTFRIMKMPGGTRYLRLEEEANGVLQEHDACVLSYFEAKLVQATPRYHSNAEGPEYRFVSEDLTAARVGAASGSEAPQQEVDDYVVFRVINVGDTDFFHRVGRQQPFYTLKLSFHAVPWEAFLCESPVAFCFPGDRDHDGSPVIGLAGPIRLRLGFCSRTFGLPRPYDSCISRCWSDPETGA